MHQDQMEFMQGMEDINQHDSHINKQRRKDIVGAIDTEKQLDKIQHPLI